MHRPTRPAFTLVELLVVITIIAVLIGLLVPAVQKVREAAMRSRCMNNLHQTGLALVQYQSDHGAFPAATRTDRGTWRQELLPYLNQEPLWRLLDHDKPWHQGENLDRGATTPIPLFLCPSVPERNPVNWVVIQGKPDRQSPKNLPGNDYETVMGIDAGPIAELLGWKDLDAETLSRKSRGAMVPNRPTSAVEITDGASQTLLVIETAGRPDLWVGKRRQAPFNASKDQIIQGLAQGTCWADPTGPYVLKKGDASNPPSSFGDTNNNSPYSFHSGGTLGAMGDGSVRFFSWSNEFKNWVALFTARGEDLVSEP